MVKMAKIQKVPTLIINKALRYYNGLPIKNNPGVIQSNTEALSNLGSGKTDAFLSGPWSKNDVEKALGDKMGAAAYPTIDFGNGENK